MRVPKTPKALNNIITAAVADPDNHTVTMTRANGDTTVSCFGHFIGKGVFASFAILRSSRK